MPLFEFQCTDCRDEFEELVRSSAAVPEVKCPRCGSGQVKRKLSMIASKVSGGGASMGSGAGASAASSCAPGGT